jgi:hypothetical protein
MPTDHLSFATLVDYAARDGAIDEQHLFTCATCGEQAAVVDALVRGIQTAFRSSEVGGFVTDDLLNHLASDGTRVRAFTLTPGARVPCAVWSDDELMAVRLRGDFGATKELTLRQRIAGTEIMRLAVELAPGQSEVIQAISASRVRQLPAVEIEIELTADDGHQIGVYTLLHRGAHDR